MVDSYFLSNSHLCSNLCKSLCKVGRFSRMVDFYWFCIKFTFAGDDNGKREEDLEEEIKDVKERFRDAEVNHDVKDAIVMKSLFKVQLLNGIGQADHNKKKKCALFSYQILLTKC